MKNSPRNNAWMGAAAIIIIGIIFLLRNVTGVELGNWWAILMLLPAAMFFLRGWNAYKQDNRLNDQARNSFILATLITLTALIFLLGLSFGTLWPVFVIIVGIGYLLRVMS